MARNPVESPLGLENESALIDTSTPFELPGLFSEIEGITSQISLPFQDEIQLISVEAVAEEYGPSSMDVCDYIQLLERPELFADPEQRRKEKNEPLEIQDD